MGAMREGMGLRTPSANQLGVPAELSLKMRRSRILIWQVSWALKTHVLFSPQKEKMSIQDHGLNLTMRKSMHAAWLRLFSRRFWCTPRDHRTQLLGAVRPDSVGTAAPPLRTLFGPSHAVSVHSFFLW